MPNDKSDTQAFLNKLTMESDGTLVLKKRFGTKLTYEAANIELQISSDRFRGGYPKIEYEYYRLSKVEDNFGNALMYVYNDVGTSKKLLPSRIYWNKNPETAIAIQEDSYGNIATIYCPENLNLSYTYGNIDYNRAELSNDEEYILPVSAYVRVLKTVSKCGENMQSYSYGENGDYLVYEKDIWNILSGDEAFTDYGYFHIDLSKITDGVGNEYRFEYRNIESRDYIGTGGNGLAAGGVFSMRKNIYYVPSGAARKISKVTIYDPATENTASSEFTSKNFVVFNPQKTNGAYSLNSSYQNNRWTEVTDPDGNKVRYTWLDSSNPTLGVVAMSIDSFAETYGLGADDSFSNPVMIYYPKMRMEYIGSGENGGPNLYEEIEFDIYAGMVPKSTRDVSGNVTSFEYEDVLPVLGSEKSLYYTAKRNADGTFSDPRYSDPTKQIDALGNVTEFSYDVNTRIMTSTKRKVANSSAVERETRWELDSTGYLRIKEEILGPNSVVAKTTLNEYNSSEFPSFLTKSRIVNGAGDGKDIVTENTPDSFGRIASSTTYAGTTYYTYNKNGRKTSAMDPNGNITRFDYNNMNRLVSVYAPDNSRTGYVYDVIGRKTYETNGIGGETQFGYNALNMPVRIARKISTNNYSVNTTAYNGIGLPSVVTDPNGNKTAMSYDALSRLVSTKKYDSSDNLKSEATMSYGANSGSMLFAESAGFKPTTTVSNEGVVTAYTYDSLYRQITKSVAYKEGSNSVTTNAYDIFGNAISITDPRGNVTTTEYSALDKPVKITNPDNTFKTVAYTSGGLVSAETDELGNTVASEYDNAGRLVKKTFPSAYDYDSKTDVSSQQTFEYDANGNLTKEIDERGYCKDTVYDSRNRKIYEILPAVELKNADGTTASYSRPKKTYEYDAVGNIVCETDPNGNRKLNEYDLLNRVIHTTIPGVMCYTGTAGALQDLHETRVYDNNGNIIRSTDAAGRITAFEYDYMNNPVAQTKNFGTSDTITEQREFDRDGRLHSVIDGKGNRTEYAYDGLNRKTLAQYGVGGDAQRERPFVYDSLNLVGDIGVSYVYDTRNRITTTADIYADSGNPTTYQYVYDAASRIVGVNNVHYKYDALGRISAEGNDGYMHRYKYDRSGNRMYAEYGYQYSGNLDSPSGSYAFYTKTTYDANDRVSRISDNRQRFVSYSYDLNGNPVRQTYQGGTVVAREYDALNRLVKAEAKNGTKKVVKGQYFYDIAGNVIRLTQISGGMAQLVENGYDPFNRLVSEKISYYANEDMVGNADIYETHYTYDAANNRTQKRTYHNGQESELVSYSLNALNQVVGTVNNGVEQTLAYDELGGVTGYDGYAFTYDGYGRISTNAIG
ncbi:MAG: hypothetical protein WC547_08675, partial [Candidatus Omnitrophota bacterium]